MTASDFFRERPGAPDQILFTRSSRTRGGIAFFGALAVPLFVAALVTAAGHVLAGVLAGLGVYLLLFRSLTSDAFARLWTYETLVVVAEAREVFWTVRRPGRFTQHRIPFEKIVRILEVCHGQAGREDTRSQLRLVAKDRPDVDLGSGRSPLAQTVGGRLASLVGVPLELERAPEGMRSSNSIDLNENIH